MFFSRGHSDSTTMSYSYHHRNMHRKIKKLSMGMIEVWEQSPWKFWGEAPDSWIFAYTLQSNSSAISHMNVLNVRNSQSVCYTYRVQTLFPNTTGDGKALWAPGGVWVVAYPGRKCIIGIFWSQANVPGATILVLFRTKMSTWTKKTVVLSVRRFSKSKFAIL